MPQTMKLPWIFFGQKKHGEALHPPRAKHIASPGAVIGVPACTAIQASSILVNKPLHLLAKSIPAGGIESLTPANTHA
ncbi:MAG: hypothetical protein AAGB07_16315 [Pseudomonadota bacterium]